MRSQKLCYRFSTTLLSVSVPGEDINWEIRSCTLSYFSFLWPFVLADIDGDVNVAILDVAEVVDTDVDVNVVSDHNIDVDDDLVTKFRTFT